jgi:hypothetical protein
MKNLKVLTVGLLMFFALGIGTSYASVNPVEKSDTGKEKISFEILTNNISFILDSSKSLSNSEADIKLDSFKSLSNPEVDIKMDYGILCRMTVSGTTDSGIKFKISGSCRKVRKALAELL